MSDLQTKLGSGMNKLQEGIEQGKQKLQIAQEIAQLKKGMQVARCYLCKIHLYI